MVIIIHSSKKRIKINLVKFLFSMAFIFALVFGTYSAFGGSNKAFSASDEYETVVVLPGDTLWSIASECNDGSFDTRKIISEIQELNNLSDANLAIGQELNIPAKYPVNR